jgi:hypothetical protein
VRREFECGDLGVVDVLETSENGGTQASSGWHHHPETGEYVLGAS